jgi:hypothetical protein
MSNCETLLGAYILERIDYSQKGPLLRCSAVTTWPPAHAPAATILADLGVAGKRKYWTHFAESYLVERGHRVILVEHFVAAAGLETPS